MKLYVFYFSRVTKEVVRDEVEVEDKPKSYKTPVHHIRSICDKGVQLPKKADYADFVL